ncbi:MAG: amidohydrolase family protein, partial [Pseudomonadota bacterium]
MRPRRRLVELLISDVHVRETPALCKLLAFAERAGVDWTVDRLYPYVAHLIDVFGPDRLIFGSNWRVVTIMATYAR